MNKVVTIWLLICIINVDALSQNGYWQQRVEYQMDIDLDVQTNQFDGVQVLKYFNNSPDTINQVYYHLYFNAFQPGSMMDVRSRVIVDPDRRIKDRIYHLKPEEQGWHKVLELRQDGKKLKYEVSGTVLEVQLEKSILPGATSLFKMKFKSQVPLQVRRSGRDNLEGIRYSMSQWFPKMAEYDESGWHADPYLHREFYAPWGDYEVNITLDQEYVVGATGILQNDKEVVSENINASSTEKNGKSKKLTWKFRAENIHDFAWAADPDFEHAVVATTSGPKVHYYYQSDTLKENWERLPGYVDKTFAWLNDKFGAYPYSDYSIIQGGDGGTEYPMATLITSYRKLGSLVGTSVHEICHNWLPMLAGVNESYLAWVDEGFADYAGKVIMSELFPSRSMMQNFERSYGAYFAYVASGKEEPLTTHADYFTNNTGYYAASYSKGAITFLQLAYIMGTEKMHKALKNYFNKWKFKHPSKENFIRAFEIEGSMELDWYFDFWANTTQTIDYAIRSVNGQGSSTNLLLEKKGGMPMPLEILVQLKDGSEVLYYIPLDIMRGVKEFEEEVISMSDWPWSNPFYEFAIEHPLSEIKRIDIDPSLRMADTDRSNNTFPFDNKLKFVGKPGN